MDIQWNPRARELFLDLVRTGPPEAFRDSASAAIEKEAERGARERGAASVDADDVARACLRVAPPAFRPRVAKSLTDRGLDVGGDAAPARPGGASAGGGAKKEGSFDSEWDRVHARIVSHREEVLRIYGMKKAAGPLRVIDLACGTGKHLLEFARDGHRCHGVDQQEWKLKKAAEQARALGLDIGFTCADLRTLDLPDRYDLVVCLYAMSTMPTAQDAERAMGTAARLLAEGGVFVFNVINKEANSVPGTPMYRSVHEENHLRDHTLGELKELLGRAQLELRTHEYSPVVGVKDLDLFVAATHKGPSDGR